MRLCQLVHRPLDHIYRVAELPVGIQQFVVGVSEFQAWVRAGEEPGRLFDGGGDLGVGRGESTFGGFEFVVGMLVDLVSRSTTIRLNLRAVDFLNEALCVYSRVADELWEYVSFVFTD